MSLEEQVTKLFDEIISLQAEVEQIIKERDEAYKEIARLSAEMDSLLRGMARGS